MLFALPSAGRIRARQEQDWVRTHRILQDPTCSVEQLVRYYINSGGSQSDHLINLLRRKIDEAAIAASMITSGGSLFDTHGRVDPPHLRELCPDEADVFFDVGPSDQIATHELLPEGINTLHDTSLPSPLNMLSHQARRPAFRIYAMRGGDLYTSPSGYQLADRARNCFWPGATSRPFAKRATIAPVLPINKHVVIVQDRFGGENFAHFLFDWITRIGHFVRSGLVPTDSCIFLMGGIPGPFQECLLRALSTVFRIEAGQCYFPEDPITLRPEGNIFWFSDQVETYTHPAQLAHERSIAVIEDLARAIPISPGRFERIYITRNDAGRRRVVNEAALWRELRKYDFEMIRLADHAMDRQIALVRGAKHIVVPHGMGLALASLQIKPATVLELHNPTVGTDAFALMARAAGKPYDFLLGTPDSGDFDDFSVSPTAVTAILDRLKVARLPRSTTARTVNLLPNSADFRGTWSPGAQLAQPAAPSYDVPALVIGSTVMRHVRTLPDGQLDNNCGNWWGISVGASRLYTATCFVWIPKDFAGSDVVLSLGEWHHQMQEMADLTRRDTWQRLRSTVTAPADAMECALVLRITASPGNCVYSTCWQLEVGPQPTDYVATPSVMRRIVPLVL